MSPSNHNQFLLESTDTVCTREIAPLEGLRNKLYNLETNYILSMADKLSY